GFLDDLLDDVNLGLLGQPPARQGAVLMDQMLASSLDRRDGTVLGGRQLDQLPGTAPRLRRDVEMIAQKQEERFGADEGARAPDGMTVALGLRLDREV